MLKYLIQTSNKQPLLNITERGYFLEFENVVDLILFKENNPNCMLISTLNPLVFNLNQQNLSQFELKFQSSAASESKKNMIQTDYTIQDSQVPLMQSEQFVDFCKQLPDLNNGSITIGAYYFPDRLLIGLNLIKRFGQNITIICKDGEQQYIQVFLQDVLTNRIEVYQKNKKINKEVNIYIIPDSRINYDIIQNNVIIIDSDVQISNIPHYLISWKSGQYNFGDVMDKVECKQLSIKLKNQQQCYSKNALKWEFCKVNSLKIQESLYQKGFQNVMSIINSNVFKFPLNWDQDKICLLEYFYHDSVFIKNLNKPITLIRLGTTNQRHFKLWETNYLNIHNGFSIHI